ncbi:g11354 [Coccomyxa elongata]
MREELAKSRVLRQDYIKQQSEVINNNAEVASALQLKLQLTQAKAMQLESRFDMRGLMDTVDRKYRAKYEADPTIPSLKGAGREGLWKSGDHILGIYVGILSNEEAKALQCLAADVNVMSEIHSLHPASSMSKVHQKLNKELEEHIWPASGRTWCVMHAY